MDSESEIKAVFIGDIAFNKDITPKRELVSVGGSAYYSAVGAMAAINREGLEQTVGAVAPVGDDFQINNLTEKGVNIEGVRIFPGQETCKFTIIQHSDNTRDFEAERLVATGVDTSIFPKSYSRSSFIHLATSLPQSYIAWINFLAESGSRAQLSADAFENFARESPYQTIEALNAVDMIFLNEEEADILLRRGSLRTDIPWVLKRGPGGVSYLEESSEINVAAPAVDSIETTGAGDTLAGAFLALLASGYEIEPALRVAVEIASLSTTQFGVEHLFDSPKKILLTG